MAAREPVHWDTNSELKVTLAGQPRVVQASEAVEANHGSLWLSNLDQNGCLSATETLYLFKARAGASAEEYGGICGNPPKIASIPTKDCGAGGGCATVLKDAAALALAEGIDDPAALVRDALARALVLFYPFTGRLRLTPEGRYEINLNGEGVVFVEAEANLELAQLGYGIGVVPPPAVATQLVVTVPSPVEGPLMAAQVTRFQCGGWVLGITMNHGVVDGGSGLKFMQVWAKLAKLGSSKSWTDHDFNFAPFALDRTCLKQRSPLQVGVDQEACFEKGAETWKIAEPAEDFVFRLKGEQLQVLKQRILQEQVCVEEKITKFTTFEVLGALLWRARTRAVEMADEEQTQMRIWVNVANKLQPPLPQGYMGNSVAKGMCVTTVGQLCSGPLSHGVALIQQALAKLTDEHIRSFIDYIGQLHPALLPSAGAPTSCLCLNSWTRLGFQLVDFGWGEAVCTGPSATNILQRNVECRLFLLPVHGKGCTMDMKMLIGLPPSAIHKFEEELREWLSSS